MHRSNSFGRQLEFEHFEPRFMMMADPLVQPAALAQDDVPAIVDDASLGSNTFDSVISQTLNLVPVNINQLVGDLGSDDFETRELASQQLLSLGPLALPALRTAAQSDDLEVAHRSRRILTILSRPLRREATELAHQIRNADLVVDSLTRSLNEGVDDEQTAIDLADWIDDQQMFRERYEAVYGQLVDDYGIRPDGSFIFDG